jgi:hypothetical protein
MQKLRLPMVLLALSFYRIILLGCGSYPCYEQNLSISRLPAVNNRPSIKGIKLSQDSTHHSIFNQSYTLSNFPTIHSDNDCQSPCRKATLGGQEER